jgi:hypothetical protein
MAINLCLFEDHHSLIHEVSYLGVSVNIRALDRVASDSFNEVRVII